jgi:hypothetical protein
MLSANSSDNSGTKSCRTTLMTMRSVQLPTGSAMKTSGRFAFVSHGGCNRAVGLEQAAPADKKIGISSCPGAKERLYPLAAS